MSSGDLWPSGGEQGLSGGTEWTPDSVPGRRLDLRIRSIRGIVVVTTHRLETRELSDSAALLFRAADGIRTLGELAALLVAEYGIDLESALADTAELLTELAGLDIVERVEVI